MYQRTTATIPSRLHDDGTVEYWSVYSQRWLRAGSVPDRELAAMDAEERQEIIAFLARHAED
jgi:hypothetical protein